MALSPAHPDAAPVATAPAAAPPPRWTFGVVGPRLRVSAGLVAWLAVGAWLVGLSPAWLGRAGPLAFVAGMVASMLVHEGAHALAAHNLGYRVEWVVLGGLTGVTAYFGRDDRPLDRAAVALAGPAASAALILGLVGLRATLPAEADLTALVELMLAFNVLALVANLLPIAGTDGAHTLGGVTEHLRRVRPRRGD
ncbi:MAG TPA: M50 family metallopeptidase [Acidimicrobiales bacterium]|jgi:Zn-dependent protease|nr:M50 family metallopeptidase [Acidimicrobiales bacterium]